MSTRPRPPTVDEPADPASRSRARLRRLAWLMDNSIRLPGGFRIGLDGLIGLIPGVGDVLAAGVSSYILAEAARMQVSGSVLARMGLNVVLDLLIGAIPVLGDLFDFAFKANSRNMRLMDAHLAAPGPTRTRSRAVVAAAVVFIVLLIAVAIAIVIALAKLLWGALTA